MNKSLAFVLLPLFACSPDSEPVLPQIQGDVNGDVVWSTPVSLGPTINSSANDFQPALSRDGLSLFFASARAGGLGNNDIYVAHRDCEECLWQAPVSVTALNSTASDGGPALSADGHLLFFHSGRPGGQGNNDIWVSRRLNPQDDFGWETPVVLGPDVNTPMLENKPAFLQAAEDGGFNLYFNRGPDALTLNDIYYARVTRSGETLGPAVVVTELSDPVATDAGAHIRKDGREVFFQSDRAGTLGLTDFFTSTRKSVHEPWSTPVHLPELSSAGNDRHIVLSHDGKTIIFASNGRGGLGGDDLFMSTRTVNGR